MHACWFLPLNTVSHTVHVCFFRFFQTFPWCVEKKRRPQKACGIFRIIGEKEPVPCTRVKGKGMVGELKAKFHHLWPGALCQLSELIPTSFYVMLLSRRTKQQKIDTLASSYLDV